MIDQVNILKRTYKNMVIKSFFNMLSRNNERQEFKCKNFELHNFLNEATKYLIITLKSHIFDKLIR